MTDILQYNGLYAYRLLWAHSHRLRVLVKGTETNIIGRMGRDSTASPAKKKKKKKKSTPDVIPHMCFFKNESQLN